MVERRDLLEHMGKGILPAGIESTWTLSHRWALYVIKNTKKFAWLELQMNYKNKQTNKNLLS